MSRFRILAVAVLHVMLVTACPFVSEPYAISTSPMQGPESPKVTEIRQFLQARHTTVVAAAGTLRETLGLPAGPRVQDAGGCHGPALAMETAASSPRAHPHTNQALLDAVVADLIDDGPADLAKALVALHASGSGLRLAADGQLDEATIALRVGDELIVSQRWVHAARRDPSSIYANLAHELSGHMKYGTPIGCIILETALAGTPAITDFDQYRAAYLTYVYPETEIYAELHELSYPSDSAIGDDPYVDIIMQVDRLVAAYPPSLAALILGWLQLRCGTDPTLSREADFYCKAAVKAPITCAPGTGFSPPGHGLIHPKSVAFMVT